MLSATTLKDTVFREGRGSVYRFQRPPQDPPEAGRPHGVTRTDQHVRSHVPVLLVPSMLHRWYVLDLCEGASVASAISTGTPWETFCFDWGVPEDEDRFTTWDDVVAKLDRVVRFVQRTTGAPKVALVGYSLGATLSAIYAALRPERIAAIVNVAGPFDFEAPCTLSHLVDPRWFDAEAMTAAGNLPGPIMQAGFFALAPTHALARWVRLVDEASDPQALRSFTALESWAMDTIPFPAAAYVTYVKELYQENRLLKGEHWVRGERVDLGRITCPVLSVVAEKDGVCPAESTTALNEAVSSDVTDVLRLEGGHVSAVVGPRASKELYPRVVDWLRRNATEANARPAESRL